MSSAVDIAPGDGSDQRVAPPADGSRHDRSQPCHRGVQRSPGKLVGHGHPGRNRYYRGRQSFWSVLDWLTSLPRSLA
jgi:hypothetical protein